MGNEICVTRRVAADFCVATSRRAANATGSAANVVLEGTQAAYEATTLRIETARAAKRMLDDGDERVKRRLLAKNAASDAITGDTLIYTRLSETTAAYDVCVKKFEAALAFQDAEQWNASDERQLFERLISEYKARSALIKTEMNDLQSVPEPPNISAIEEDAISLLLTRMKVFESESKELDSPSELQKSITSPISTNSTAASVTATETTTSTAGPASAAAPEEVGILKRAQESAQAARQAANEWVDNAEEGKRMATEGGKAIIAKIVAKKASVGSTSLDHKAVEHIASVCEAYGKAVRNIQATEELKSGNATSEPAVLHSLAAKYQTRIEHIRRLFNLLQSVPESTGFSASEQDALVYSSWRETLGY